MPTVMRIGAYRFHFFSDERGEPPHIHVASGDDACKFWLDPVRLATNTGMEPHRIREVERLVFEHASFFREKYHEFHQA
ncbi:MAG: DUF4160 domain-containing protein [Lentisphaeria bacterium]